MTPPGIQSAIAQSAAPSSTVAARRLRVLAPVHREHGDRRIVNTKIGRS
jgi:hypothetical protein